MTLVPDLVNRNIIWIVIALLLCALTDCSLLHQEQANQAPAVQSRQASPRQISRNGRVELRVLADDEDDDPLFYNWSAFGVGSFTDSTQATTTWLMSSRANT